MAAVAARSLMLNSFTKALMLPVKARYLVPSGSCADARSWSPKTDYAEVLREQEACHGGKHA